MPRLLAVTALLLASLSPASGTAEEPRRYLLYDVTAGEGFNLRRSVLPRAIALTLDLGPEWTLVLPPFHRMVQWKAAGPALLPWSTFFDTAVLAEVAPVVEYEEYVRREGRAVDHVVRLQSGAPYTSRPAPCAATPVPPMPEQQPDGTWSARVFGGVEPIAAADVRCQEHMGPFTLLEPTLRALPGRRVLVAGLQMTLWDDRYGGEVYWRLRRHTVFAKRLRDEADRFVKATFGSQPYLAVHLRRGDFLKVARPHPSLEDVVAQVRSELAKRGLTRLFLATDAAPDEVAWLRERLSFERYAPPAGLAFDDGEVAIVDQIVASRGAAFLGTAASTFTDAILEEREVAGQPEDTTWRVLCPRGTGEDPYACAQPARPGSPSRH